MPELWHSGPVPRLTFVRLLYCAAIALVSAGCGKGSPPPAKAAPPRLEGQWLAKVDPTGADPKDPEAVRAVMAARNFESMTDLRFPSEDRYAICGGGYLVEGTVESKDGKVTLHPEKLNGLDPEKAKSGGVTIQASALEPVTLEIREDGTLAMPPGKYGERLTFTRSKPEVGPERTSATEKGLVGRWKVEKVEGITQRQVEAGFDYLLQQTAINLQRDLKFQMRFIYRLEGSWKLEGDTVALTYPSGRMKAKREGERLVLTSPDGSVRVLLRR